MVNRGPLAQGHVTGPLISHSWRGIWNQGTILQNGFVGQKKQIWWKYFQLTLKEYYSVWVKNFIPVTTISLPCHVQNLGLNGSFLSSLGQMQFHEIWYKNSDIVCENHPRHQGTNNWCSSLFCHVGKVAKVALAGRLLSTGRLPLTGIGMDMVAEGILYLHWTS